VPKHDPYFIEAAAKILDVLELFHRGDEELTVVGVARALKLPKSSAFRLLYTLEHKGYIERAPDERVFRRRRRFRLGFASLSPAIAFTREVDDGILLAAREAGFDVTLLHGEFDPKRTVTNVETLLAQGVDLILIYNPLESLSHVIADRCAEAQVPLVSITFPVPGGRRFGINNYRAGRTGGEGLGDFARRTLGGKVDKVIVLDIPGSSPAQEGRIAGMLDGLRRFLELPDDRVLHLHAAPETRDIRPALAEILADLRQARKLLMLSYNDLNALRAVEVVYDARRAAHAYILSQGGAADARAELRKPGSPLWGAVAHFPERFGERLIPILGRVLRGDAVPMELETDHVLLTRATIKEHYPVG
jgi:ribose transport system substrate-binding protein